MKENNLSSKKSQKGVTLVELILVIGIISFISVIDMEKKRNELEQKQARILGIQLMEYNNAARAWLASNVGATNSHKTGSLWLKHKSCGGPNDVSYLDCDFPEATKTSPLPIGLISLDTSITTSGTEPNQITEIRTITSPYSLTGGDIRSDLAGVASLIGAASNYSGNNATSLTADSSFSSSPESGVITMTVRNNGFDDPWLRTDGSNLMNSNLKFNDKKSESKREIHNSSRIQNIVGQALKIGNLDGGELGYSVVVDAKLEVLGGLLVNKSAKFNSTMEVSGDLYARQDLKVTTNISAGGGIFATKDIETKSNMIADRFIDSDNNLFYVDPSKTTNLSTLNLKNELQVDGIATLNDSLVLNKIVSKGANCSPNGSLARDLKGKALSCQSGRWDGISGLNVKTMTIGSGTIQGYDFCALAKVSNVEDAHYCSIEYDPVSKGWRAKNYKCYGMKVSCLAL